MLRDRVTKAENLTQNSWPRFVFVDMNPFFGVFLTCWMSVERFAKKNNHSSFIYCTVGREISFQQYKSMVFLTCLCIFTRFIPVNITVHFRAAQELS